MQGSRGRTRQEKGMLLWQRYLRNKSNASTAEMELKWERGKMWPEGQGQIVQCSVGHGEGELYSQWDG